MTQCRVDGCETKGKRQSLYLLHSLTACRRRAVLAGGSVYFLFLVLSATNPKPPLMMSSSANGRPFLSSFRHIPPQESFVQLANLTIQTKNGRRGERPIWSNLG